MDLATLLTGGKEGDYSGCDIHHQVDDWLRGTGSGTFISSWHPCLPLTKGKEELGDLKTGSR